MAASDGWVLHRAHAGTGLRLRWSAAAHMLLVAGGFAGLFLIVLSQVVRSTLPPPAGPAAGWALLMAALAQMVGSAVLMAWRARSRVALVEVDPAGLLLHTPRGTKPARIKDLVEVSVGAEPAFGHAHAHTRRGGLAELPDFVATLRLRLRDGTRWEFATTRTEDLEGVIAWLGVLGAGDKLRGAPSALAAEHVASDAMLRARWLMVAAIGAMGVTVLLQFLSRNQAAMAPWALALSLACIAAGCGLYASSYLQQRYAAAAWLELRGLNAGPPARHVEEALVGVLAAR